MPSRGARAARSRALHRDQRIVGAVLDEHRHVDRAQSNASGSPSGTRAHREHPGRAGGFTAAAAPSPSASPAPCEKPANDRWLRAGSRAPRTARRAGRRARPVRRRRRPSASPPNVVPGEPGRAGHRERRARQHRRESPVGVEVREEAAEIALVGAVAVHEQQQPFGRRSLHDVRDQGHACRLRDAVRDPLATVRSGRPSPADRRRAAASRVGRRSVLRRRHEREVRERLREVAEHSARGSYSSANRPTSLATSSSRSNRAARLVASPDRGERVDHPEAAREEHAFWLADPVDLTRAGCSAGRNRRP